MRVEDGLDRGPDPGVLGGQLLARPEQVVDLADRDDDPDEVTVGIGERDHAQRDPAVAAGRGGEAGR